MSNYWNIFNLLPWLVKIFRCVLVTIIHLVLFGQYFLVIGAVMEHQVRDYKAGHLLLFTEMDHQVSSHLEEVSLPRLSLGSQFLLLQVAYAAVWASIQMPVMCWNIFL